MEGWTALEREGSSAEEGSQLSQDRAFHRPAAGRTVVHFDADCFFVQVECRRRRLSAQERALPICVQQHQDIISSNRAAQRCGVLKYMTPAEARKAVRARHGLVLHVFTEESGRVSYRPYRRASSEVMAVLRSCPDLKQFEVASIDEAFVELRTRDLAEAGRIARDMIAKCHLKTGYALSAGVAENKLLAKLASSHAKRTGGETVVVVPNEPEAQQLLRQTSPHKLPGFGQKRALFSAKGARASVDLQQFSTKELGIHFELRAAQSELLFDYARGLDVRPVVPEHLPKSFGTHSSFTTTAALQQFHDGGVSSRKELKPVYTTADPRLKAFLIDMAAELLERICEDRQLHARRPQTLILAYRRPGVDKNISHTAPFPHLKLDGQPPPKDSLAVRTLVRVGLDTLGRLTRSLPPDVPISRVSMIATRFTHLDKGTVALTGFLKRKRRDEPGSEPLVASARPRLDQPPGSAATAARAPCADMPFSDLAEETAARGSWEVFDPFEGC